MGFRDRADAGRRLAVALAAYKDQDPVILALPRGGVPVAAEIAQAFGAPLDLLLVRKIGVPGQTELAAGAVVDGPEPIIVRNEGIIEQAQVSAAEFDRVKTAEIAEIRRRRMLYLGNRSSIEIAGRIAIVVDDGIATGATMRAAIRALRQRQPRRLVLAIPVAHAQTLRDIGKDVDAVICLEAVDRLGSVGAFYGNFAQVPDGEVISILARFAPPQELG